MGAAVTLRANSAELRLPALLTNEVPRGVVYVSSHYGGGAVAALLPSESGRGAMPVVKLMVAAASASTPTS
jgi:predicted molibdopterin-dependent oxidoreductase YjgC